MALLIAIQAFIKAFKNPKKAKEFLEDHPKQVETQDPSHLRLLKLLQHSGRLVDFLKEDIKDFSDQQIGAAVREIHQGSQRALEEYVTLRPVRDEEEGSEIHIPKGYDPSEIKVIGNVAKEPPYQGILIHKGWKAHKRSLPKSVGEQKNEIIQPAEVEIQ